MLKYGISYSPRVHNTYLLIILNKFGLLNSESLNKYVHAVIDTVSFI
jgi:hypothetical protein